MSGLSSACPGVPTGSVMSGRALRVLSHRQCLEQAKQLNPEQSLLTNVSRDFFV
jgi:hypothetical protein